MTVSHSSAGTIEALEAEVDRLQFSRHFAMPNAATALVVASLAMFGVSYGLQMLIRRLYPRNGENL
jgi:hypothetical protein